MTACRRYEVLMRALFLACLQSKGLDVTGEVPLVSSPIEWLVLFVEPRNVWTLGFQLLEQRHKLH